MWSGGGGHGPIGVDDAEQVALLHDEELLTIELHLGAGPFAEQNPIALVHVGRHKHALLVPLLPRFAGAGRGGNANWDALSAASGFLVAFGFFASRPLFF